MTYHHVEVGVYGESDKSFNNVYSDQDFHERFPANLRSLTLVREAEPSLTYPSEDK